MSKRIRDYIAGGLLTLLSSCVSDPSIDNEADRIFSVPNIDFTPQREHLIRELDIYLTGPVIEQIGEGTYLKFPVRKRDGNELSVLLSNSKLYPEIAGVVYDEPTNQLILRMEKVQNQEGDAHANSLTLRASVVQKLLESLDTKSPHYDIVVYNLQVSATYIDSVKSSLDLLIKTGDVNIALNSNNIYNNRESGILHEISGVIDTFIPEAKVTALFDGLESKGFVRNYSQTTIVTDHGRKGKVLGKRRVPVPEFLPTNPPVVAYRYTDVDRVVEVTPKSRADGEVNLEINISNGTLVQSSSVRDLFDIFTRTTSSNITMPIGNMLILQTTLDDTISGANQRSPLGEVFGSSRRNERNRVYELVAILPMRVNLSSPSKGWSREQMEKELNRKDTLKN